MFTHWSGQSQKKQPMTLNFARYTKPSKILLHFMKTFNMCKTLEWGKNDFLINFDWIKASSAGFLTVLSWNKRKHKLRISLHPSSTFQPTSAKEQESTFFEHRIILAEICCLLMILIPSYQVSHSRWARSHCFRVRTYHTYLPPPLQQGVVDKKYHTTQ